jgi:hypothetical protein
MVYFVVRIGVWPFMLDVYGKRLGLGLFQALISIPVGCKFGLIGMGSINCIWWTSLVGKILRGSRSKKDE